jgi:RNA polymerase sigma-70 factor (ECF subfamily)
MRTPVTHEAETVARFEATILPHLDAAHNLARWLTGNDQDAEDVAQEAILRAFKFFGGFRGENGRAWLLSIARRSAFNWMAKNRHRASTEPFDEETGPADGGERSAEFASLDATLLRKGIEELPPEFREIIVLREFEDLAYEEIATVLEVPIGTVMSRLSRARRRLRVWWTEESKETRHELS